MSNRKVPITRISKFFGSEDFQLEQEMGMEWLNIDVSYGDYIGYLEKEDRMRYYVVTDDGRVTSDNAHTIGGYKAFYRTVKCSWVSENEFKGI